MELTPSSEPAELGFVPEGWDVVSLGELFEFRNGVNADKGAYGAGTRFINVLEIITRAHIAPADIPGRVALPKSAIERYSVRRGDLVFNRTSETQQEVGLAAAYVGDEEVVFGGFVIRARPKDGSLDHVFAGYALRSRAVRVQITARGQGAIRANIGQADLGCVLIPRPPLPEQRAIAGALGEVDSLIESLKGLIKKKRDLRGAAAHELLTGRARLLGFDGTWERRRLGDIATIVKGSGLSKGALSESGSRRCLLYGELFTTYGRVIREVFSRTDATGGLPSKDGDVLVPGSTTTTGLDLATASALTLGDVALGGDINVIRQRSGSYNPLFLANYLTHVARRAIAEAAQGITIIHLYGRDLAGLELRLPPLDEQSAIGMILSDMDAEIEALEARLAKTRDLKQGMAQDLLTGRTRMA